MGFIPDRWSGAVLLSPAVPAFLTPLSATLVHGGFLHLALNLIILMWCGTQVERVLGPKALVIPKKRKKTRPPAASRERRLEHKKRQSEKKRFRRKGGWNE